MAICFKTNDTYLFGYNDVNIDGAIQIAAIPTNL